MYIESFLSSDSDINCTLIKNTLENNPINPDDRIQTISEISSEIASDLRKIKKQNLDRTKNNRSKIMQKVSSDYAEWTLIGQIK